jgi:hypothetical protein
MRCLNPKKKLQPLKTVCSQQSRGRKKEKKALRSTPKVYHRSRDTEKKELYSSWGLVKEPRDQKTQSSLKKSANGVNVPLS